MDPSIWTQIEHYARVSNEINEYLDKVRTLVDFDNLDYEQKGKILFLFARIKREQVEEDNGNVGR